MVECESCEEWFHFSCLGLKSKNEVKGKWCCNVCNRQGVPVTLGKPQEFTPPAKK